MSRKAPKLLLAIVLLSTVTACTRTKSSSITTIAPRAVVLTQEIVFGKTTTSIIRGGALLGVYSSQHLVSSIVFRSALAGIVAQQSFLSESAQEQEESFALLETLGSLLQVDVPDMLNRSSVRSQAFDIYISNLQTVGGRANTQVERLETQIDATNAVRRTQRSEAAQTQSQLNRAIRNEDYTTASDLQKKLIELEGKVAVTEAEMDKLRSIKNLLTDMIDTANSRFAVMTANREALLAGIKVIDLPGAKDLGILDKGSRFKQSGGSIFDPQTLQ